MKKFDDYIISGINENGASFSYFDNDQYVIDEILNKINEGLNITDNNII